LLLERSGLGQQEFASRTGVPIDQFSTYLSGTASPQASLMIRMRRLSDRFAKMRSERATGPAEVPIGRAATFVLIPGAGGSACIGIACFLCWVRRVRTPSPSNCPPQTTPRTSARTPRWSVPPYPRSTGAGAGGQSMGAFTAPMVAEGVPTSHLVLVNPMVPMAASHRVNGGMRRAGRRDDRALPPNRSGRQGFDPVEDFFHDVPAQVREEAFSQPEPRQSDTPFGQTWPLDGWPDVPTHVIVGSDDRFFPLEFQRRVVRERLGLDVDVMPGGPPDGAEPARGVGNQS